jgi:hypothetical protein
MAEIHAFIAKRKYPPAGGLILMVEVAAMFTGGEGISAYTCTRQHTP